MLWEKLALPPGLPLACLLLASAAFLAMSADRPPVTNETGVSARWSPDTRKESSRHDAGSSSPGLKSLLSLAWHSATNLRRLNNLKGAASVADDETTHISSSDKSVKEPLGPKAKKSKVYNFDENYRYEQMLKIPREMDEDVKIQTASNLNWNGFANKRLEDHKREAQLNVHPESESLPVAKMVATSAFLSPRSHNRGKPLKRSKPSGCRVPDEMHIPCGPAHVTPEACLSLGCCADIQKAVCFYPLEACTKDNNFVFVVYRNSTWPEINLHTLRVGQEACPLLLLTEDFALFKFGLGECGTSVFEIGSTSLFIAEVLGSVVTYSQAFGEISRELPYNFKMQCSYSEGSLVSLGYIVKSLPPQSVVSHPIDPGVQLRVAKDKCYTQYYPETGLPLRLLLGSSLYLELCLLNSPDPDAKLLVNYCIAYPRSSEAAWVLIYNGCPNTLDPSPSHLRKSPHNHCRRFEVKTFQFVDRRTKAYLDEEIYILCSTEICSSAETSCDGACFDHTGLHVSRLPEEEQQHSTVHVKGI
ncbi:zona pellucida sperm-binding protein 4-like isoform X8 [Erpetoichthys calabaricus]|uniref:zona pellucida sperm-binding protein 4-like isoform X8 n=1 Tax=Erpetoichthys calabaricus TaxID=27687 RepID=UPI0022346915|nr:zona pellucida sperm-binding protein 4-like isoform X8 [Erpetoichthys calabaricus]